MKGSCRESLQWWYVTLASLFIASSVLMNGYDVGSTGGVEEMRGFQEFFNLSSEEGNTTGTCSSSHRDDYTSLILGLVVSLYSVGSLVGSLIGGPLSDTAGRRATLVTGVLVFATGIIVQTAAFFMWMLLIGRVWTGIGNGIVTQLASMYISELAPKQLRGKLAALPPTMATLGILSGSLVNLAVNELDFGWRVTSGAQFLFACVVVIASPFIPESPRWLVKKKKSKKALRVINKIYKDEAAATTTFEEISSSFQKTQYDSRVWKLFCSWDIAHRLILGFSLLFFARINGSQLVLYFSVSIFCKIGVSGYIGGVIIGGTIVTAQIIVLFLSDRFGRKVILLLGYSVMILCLACSSVLILVFHLDTEESPTVPGYFVVVFIAVFVGTAMLSAVTQAWIISGEIFPLRIKGICVSVSATGWWCGNILSGELSPFLLSSQMGTAGTFLLHTGICVIALLFVLLLVPETKKLSLEQVDQLFSAPLLQRTNPIYYLTCGRRSKRRGFLVTSDRKQLVSVSMEELNGTHEILTETNTELPNSQEDNV